MPFEGVVKRGSVGSVDLVAFVRFSPESALLGDR